MLDEATAHLDAATGDALAAEILAATDGRTALVVTPRPDQVAGLSVVEIGDARRCTPAGDFTTGPVVTVRADTAVQESARPLVSHSYSVLPALRGDNGLLAPSAPDLASAGLLALVPLRSGDDPRVG